MAPYDFVAPPRDELIEESSGTLLFKGGKYDPMPWIDGQTFACRFSRMRGPHGPCLEKFSKALPMAVKAHWYWHPTAFGMRTRMLISVSTIDGKTLLSPYTQRSQLLAWGMASGISTPVLAVIFVGAFLVTLIFQVIAFGSRKRQQRLVV
jgi:hypothetical protein